MYTKALLIALLLPLTLGLGCDSGSDPQDELIELNIPEDDPGPPFYARVTPIMNEFFHSNGWLAIPFYREPDCIPPDFDLLGLYHFSSESDPGAFGCPLLLEGVAYIEPDAPPNSFPKHVTMQGLGAVPVWFVPMERFEPAVADEELTLAELKALDPQFGTATSFKEELRPRAEDHNIDIASEGTLNDGRSFRFNLLHTGDTIERIEIAFE